MKDPAEAAGVKAVLGALAESEAQWLAAVDRHPTKQSLAGRQSMMDMLCGALLPLLCVCMAVFGGQADGKNAQNPKRVAHVSFPRALAPRVHGTLSPRQPRQTV